MGVIYFDACAYLGLSTQSQLNDCIPHPVVEPSQSCSISFPAIGMSLSRVKASMQRVSSPDVCLRLPTASHVFDKIKLVTVHTVIPQCGGMLCLHPPHPHTTSQPVFLRLEVWTPPPSVAAYNYCGHALVAAGGMRERWWTWNKSSTSYPTTGSVSM